MFGKIDPRSVPLPNGTKVTSTVELVVGDRVIPQGAVGQVIDTAGGEVKVRLADGTEHRYLRKDVVPTKLGQMRYAVRREAAWEALRSCVVIETVVGSRAWGLADASSDVDKRGVFVLPFSWTTSLAEAPGELISADGSDTYWEVEKAIRQALRADPNTLETLFLPCAKALSPMGAWLLEARDAFLSREIYGSFGRYALSQLKKLRQSMRLATHRAALVEWLRADPALSLDDTAKRLARAAAVEAPSDRDRELRAKRYIKQLYGSLHDRGLLKERKFPALVAFAQTEQAALELPRQLRPKNAYNLIRLIATATQWLGTGAVEFEVKGELRAELMAIKRGEVPLDDVVKRAESMMPALDRARDASPLPLRPDIRRVDAALRRIRHEAARLHVEGKDATPPMPEIEPEDP